MNSSPIKNKHIALVEPDFAPVCTDEGFHISVSPGEYELRCVEQKIYRSKLFKRWVCKLVFQFMPRHEEDGTICFFLNLGDGNGPNAQPRSKYRRYWSLANGSKPRRADRMTARVFLNKIFLARVDYTEKTYDGGQHNSVSRNSVVRDLVRVTGP